MVSEAQNELAECTSTETQTLDDIVQKDGSSNQRNKQ